MEESEAISKRSATDSLYSIKWNDNESMLLTQSERLTRRTRTSRLLSTLNFLAWYDPSRSSMGKNLTKCLTEASTRNVCCALNSLLCSVLPSTVPLFISVAANVCRLVARLLSARSALSDPSWPRRRLFKRYVLVGQKEFPFINYISDKYKPNSVSL